MDAVDVPPPAGPRRAREFGLETVHGAGGEPRPFHCWWPYVTSGCISGVASGFTWVGLA